MELNARILHARNESGLTQEQLAEAVGKTRGAVAQWEAGTVRPRHSTLVAIAEATRTPLLWLESGTSETEATPPTPAEEGLEVLGVIEAGNFRDISLISQDEERERIGVGKDPRFPKAAQYALRVSGDSMNQKYPDGSYVTCVNLEESGLKLKPGLIVHVEQTRDGGLLTEVSLKEIQSTNGVTMLIPRSTNPKHGPLTYDQGETSTVKIRGIVTGMWQPEKL